MNILCQITKDLVKNYDHCLEKRLEKGASNLTCDDEVLRKDAEAILENAGAEDMHSLGLDPLKVLEESLKATAALPVSTASPCKRGLRGLAKAFEVLEQAALNLYLSPWREEYKVVKMYSGIFTHCIKPVLSTVQIAKLFGLLGYQPCIGQQDQLLQGRSGVPSHGQLLELSCGFFLARCECQLLLAALGNHGGEAEWELGMVVERRRGHSLQLALDNTKKMLDTNQILTEEVSEECGAGGELELDLYTAGGLKSVRGETAGFHDANGGPRSLSWVSNHGGPSTTTVLMTQSNGFSIPSSSSSTTTAAAGATAPGSRAREPLCVSTLNCQLSKTSPPRQIPSGATRTASAATKQVASPDEDSQSHNFDRSEVQPSIAMMPAFGLPQSEDSSPPSPEHVCGCVQLSSSHLKICLDCNTLHGLTCSSLQKCSSNQHILVRTYKNKEKSGKTRPPSSQGLHEPGWCRPPSRAKDEAAMSMLLCDTTDSIVKTPQPITFHSCCDQTLEPQYVCFTCKVFHSDSCREWLSCEQGHKTKPLQVCPCGMACPRTPIVLCRYCGTEYCTNCWYRNPVQCTCGETFDNRSSF
ncbi:spermatogenesis associated 2-like [Gadus chalcogrammus]|uniref:spermatogenesis associated 2-like n=1 Tax=Gadus chalcogrammus TaxID=1042646 RepID=UPI0024C49D57|nr:spermatogenesis associated 2-like [Gadus chalcogrammus]XP_056454400.1 spermatogenesis associated 2-like [Gadus chalcogrammus]